MRRFFLTIDVEDWFQVENLKGVIRPEEWNSCEIRVKNNVVRILDFLDSFNGKATFFVLGWLAEKFPEMVKEIYKRGHEIASHGYAHQLVYTQTPEEFILDLKRSKEILEGIIGERVLGYRAPSFSITDWAVDILKEWGYLYDSSYCPTSFHNRYGKLNLKPGTNTNVFQFPNGLKEFPLPVLNIGGISIPWGGGAYFRLIPYPIFKFGVRRILKESSYVFYFHPWEIDPLQPKMRNIKLNHKIRHYWGLSCAEKKLVKLLRDFSFRPIKSYVNFNDY